MLNLEIRHTVVTWNALKLIVIKINFLEILVIKVHSVIKINLQLSNVVV